MAFFSTISTTYSRSNFDDTIISPQRISYFTDFYTDNETKYFSDSANRCPIKSAIGHSI